jgi:hypothetical protein
VEDRPRCWQRRKTFLRRRSARVSALVGRRTYCGPALCRVWWIYSIATSLSSGSIASTAAGAISRNVGRFKCLGSEILFWAALASVGDTTSAISTSASSTARREVRVGTTRAGDCVRRRPGSRAASRAIKTGEEVLLGRERGRRPLALRKTDVDGDGLKRTFSLLLWKGIAEADWVALRTIIVGDERRFAWIWW